ncbi:MAG: PilZ domain-containing protein [Phycisphaerae bacterium]|nr:PilZ domain-containing protein [Phycisphaerae bacterium]
MAKTPKTNSRRIVEECVEFARRNGGRACQVGRLDRPDRRASLRMGFAHYVCYCPNSTLSEDHTKPARMLDISLGGIVLWCCEAVTEGIVIHVRLPLLDGKTAWVRGRVVRSSPDDVEHYWVGIAFILDRD